MGKRNAKGLENKWKEGKERKGNGEGRGRNEI